MTEAELLTSVKNALGITGDYQNETVKLHMYEVLSFLSDSGVPDAIIKSEEIVGVVVRGVSDLWNFGNSGGKLSEYFIQRAIQLKYKKAEV